MTTFDSIGIAPSRIVGRTRLVLLFLAAVALVALSFTIGRATMGHTGSVAIAPAAVQPAAQFVVQPAPAPVAAADDNPATACHGVHRPC